MKKVFLALLVLLAGFAGIFVLSRTLESIKPRANDAAIDDDLYFNARALAAVGHDFRGLIADWYWVNSLQYLGGKIVASGEKVNINDLTTLNPRLLYPMLDTAATVDPQFTTIYSYGATVLPAIDEKQAIKLLEKGIAANPQEWRLYNNLGYIYWQSKNYERAAAVYAEGATKAGAPVWMRQMSASMQAQGGSRDFALQVYRQMFETAEDEQTKSFAELRYMQIETLIAQDNIRPVLENFQRRYGRCPNSWREIANELRIIKLNNNQTLSFDGDFAPLDPLKIPYLLSNRDGQCDVAPNSAISKIPQ